MSFTAPEVYCSAGSMATPESDNFFAVARRQSAALRGCADGGR